LLKATLVYDYEEMRIYKVVNDEVEKEWEKQWTE
jgi:hypothetical protein